ncbi:MAG: hypothetical protein K8R67_02555 [Desulfobacteraceae bacterium]|nr:hypothetical protein [Desulfobacteraceae bacterium]
MPDGWKLWNRIKRPRFNMRKALEKGEKTKAWPLVLVGLVSVILILIATLSQTLDFLLQQEKTLQENVLKAYLLPVFGSVCYGIGGSMLAVVIVYWVLRRCKSDPTDQILDRIRQSENVLHGTINFVKKGHQLGIEDIVKKRSEYRKEYWNAFVERTREKCWLMGTSLSKWSEDAEFWRIVREKLQGINNYELKLLILDPNSEEAVYRNTQEDKTTNRIKRSIGNFQKNFDRIFKNNRASKNKAEIRLYRQPLSNSILIFDDELIAGHYLSSLPNKDAIALHLKKISGPGGDLFTEYSEHFKSVWDKAYRISDHDDDKLRSSRVVHNCRFCAPDHKSYKDKNHIFYKDEYFYVMNSWGQMIDGYLLINTIEHVNSCSKISDDQIDRFTGLKQKIKSVLLTVYPDRKVIFYEHGRSDYCKITDDDDDHCYHAHLHCVPVHMPVNIHSKVKDESLCLVYNGPSDKTSLKHAYAMLNREYLGPYIYIEQNDNIWIYCGTRNLRRQFLRWALAKALNCAEEKACWVTAMEKESSNEFLKQKFAEIKREFEKLEK